MNRTLRHFFSRWKYLMFACSVTYLVVVYIPLPKYQTENREEGISSLTGSMKDKENQKSKTIFNFNPVGKDPFEVEEIMTYSSIKLKERMTADVKKGEKRLILSWNAGHSADNLKGCQDWNCEFTHDRNRAKDADVVLMSHHDPEFKRNSQQYVIYFSQESPVNAGVQAPSPDYFNMTLGFRHDTPTSSPYGYTVKLGPNSRIPDDKSVVDEDLVNKKSKGAAWYVSHCGTNSKREVFVERLKKIFPVDVYGICGKLSCPRNGQCETMLDKDYHFYVAFENSICKDYVTEKLWRQGYQKTVIPLVMKRSLVEPFVPPNSFIAIDDFKSAKEMGEYLTYLMSNKTAYMEYFDWRHDYKVVFLDGSHHDILEKPWGFCQACRMAWTSPRQTEIIPDWDVYWRQTCEKDGTLVNSIL